MACIVFVATTPRSLFAQEQAVWIGLRTGCDLGTIHFTSDVSPDLTIGWKPGITVGLEWDYWFSENIGMAVEPSFIQKGLTETSSSPFIAGDKFSATFSYLQMPVLFKFAYGQSVLKPYFFIGPSIGYKLSATVHETVNGQQKDEDIADSEVTTVNLSIFGGIGLRWDVEPSIQLFIESGYDFGLTNLDPLATKTSTPSIENPFAYTRDIIISTGFLYRF
ncbi:MAG TPA: porin family protein [Candidatus Kapabacteria bacterium]|nr:porin family protein [Candidatus Kapabacteria bacterium]